jgi:caffeoyl-CoA O-methyltransferase
MVTLLYRMPRRFETAIEDYADRCTTRPPEPLAHASELARAGLGAELVTGYRVGRLLEMLVFATRAEAVLELGTYGGTSALWLAQALPPGGRVVTCEIDESAAALAKAVWADAPGGERIELRIGPAAETIAALDGPFDLIFIDADKSEYTSYLDALLPKLTSRGMVVADNTLWSGRVLDARATDAETEGIRRFNQRVASDPMLVATLLTVRDGLTLVRKA